MPKRAVRDHTDQGILVVVDLPCFHSYLMLELNYAFLHIICKLFLTNISDIIIFFSLYIVPHGIFIIIEVVYCLLLKYKLMIIFITSYQFILLE
jgi:hypothetical protein